MTTETVSWQTVATADLPREHFIDGAYRPSLGGEASVQITPVAGAEFGTVAEGMAQDVDVAVRSARDAFTKGTWSRCSPLEPTIFADVRSNMRIAREEIFGPVLSIMTFSSPEEAIALANDTEYGLAAGVWTSDLSSAHRFSRELQAGSVYINTYDAADLSVPFGGYKQSGFGRDKSLHALRAYTQLKSTFVSFG